MSHASAFEVRSDNLGDISQWACSTDDYAYSVQVYAGTYRITAQDNGTTRVPDVTMEIDAARSFSASTNHDVDVPVPATVTVSGRVRMNGGPIELDANETSGCVRLRFGNASDLDDVSQWACSTDDYAYSVQLYAGTYRITAEDNGTTRIPDVVMEVSAAQVFSTSTTYHVNVPVPATVTISGRLRQNGGAIELDTNETSGCVRVHFYNADSLGNVSQWACSTDDYAFSVQLYAGTYRITAEDNGTTRIPDVTMEIAAAQVFSSSRSYDVNVPVPATVTITGNVLMNGGPVELDANETSGCVRLRFDNAEDLDDVSQWACSTDNYAYSVQLYAGTYRITAEDNGTTRIPDTIQEVTAAAVLSSSGRRDVNISVPATVTITGVVTMNGGPIELDTNETSGCVRLRFDNADDLGDLSQWACSTDNYAYSVQLYAGTYRITAQDNGTTRIPDVTVEIAAQQVFNGSTSYNVDVPTPPTVTAAGRVLMNGGPIELDANETSGCIRLRFDNRDDLDDVSQWACSADGYAFSVQVYGGAYRITAEDNGTTRVPDVTREVVGSIRLE